MEKLESEQNKLKININGEEINLKSQKKLFI